VTTQADDSVGGVGVVVVAVDVLAVGPVGELHDADRAAAVAPSTPIA